MPPHGRAGLGRKIVELAYDDRRFQLIWKIGKQREEFVKPLEGQTAVDLSVDRDLCPASETTIRGAVVIE